MMTDEEKRRAIIEAGQRIQQTLEDAAAEFALCCGYIERWMEAATAAFVAASALQAMGVEPEEES